MQKGSTTKTEEKAFEEIMDKNFPNLLKIVHTFRKLSEL